MSTRTIVFIIIIAVLVAAIALLYWFGKRQEKKRDEQQATIDQNSQFYTMLIIDKKKIRLKDSGLPDYVINETPKYARRTKVPVVKAKVGPKITLLIADNDIYDMIPVKKEVKARVAGIYITEVRGVRGPLPQPEKKKKGFIQRIMGEK